ncbi:MAG: peptide-binding protein [Nitrospirae bacterium]|nr:peptide-binding protein [Nitrospirota bacterium]
MQKFLKIFSILFAGIIILSGCRGDVKKSRAADTITIAISSEPKRLNPVFLTDLISYSVSGLIFSGLTKFDKDMKIKGDLAESWDILDGGRKIIFHLKKDVLWHDGNQFTANDVVFTYNTFISPSVATSLKDNFGSVKEVRALDPYTVSVSYDEPYGSALESWTVGIIPKHILQHKDVNNTSFENFPVGTGPYKLREWVHGQRLWLEAFDSYHAGRPKITNLIIRIIPDTATQFLELKAGSIDLMELSPMQFNNKTGHEDLSSDFVKYRAGSFRYGFLGLNLIDRRFQDKRVRQAISYAIDKDAIINSVLRGFGSRSTGPYPPEAWYYNREAKSYAYNPQKALELMIEAGWKKGTDGILRKNADLMSFMILTNYENKENIKTAQIIQSNLKAIGIETDIRTLEWQAFRHNVISKHQFEAIVLSRAYLWDPDIYELWHSSKTKEGEWNFLSYKNKELDMLLENGRRAITIADRQRIYHKLHELLAEEQPCIFLYNADLLFIAHKRIKGIITSPAGMLHNIAEWYVEQ